MNKVIGSSLGLAPDITLGKAIEAAMNYFRPRQNLDRQKQFERNIKRLSKCLGSGILVRDIRRDHMLQFVDWLQRHQLNVWVGLTEPRSFFKLMAEEEIVANPIQRGRLPIPRTAGKKKPLFSLEQYEAVLAESARPLYRDYWPNAILIAWHTGLRCGDVCTLKWVPLRPHEGSFVDLPNDQIVARPGKSTARRQRLEIPLSPELSRHLRLLYELRDTSLGMDWVMPAMARDYRTGSRSEIIYGFRKICDACGLIEHSFHSFRHTFVSRLVRAGVSPIVIAEMTGQTLEVIQRYSRVGMEEKQAALSAIQPTAQSRLRALGFTPPIIQV
jgi:integrase